MAVKTTKSCFLAYLAEGKTVSNLKGQIIHPQTFLTMERSCYNG